MKISFTPRLLLVIAFAQAVIAIAGSLYFSEIELFEPCVLCWWQRVAIYPQILILGAALINKDWQVWRYSLPLLGAGWLVSVYHNILYYSVNSGGTSFFTPCVINGPSCTTKYIEYFGFVTIPLLALIAITIMIVCVFWAGRLAKTQS